MASYHWTINSGKKGSAKRHSSYIIREGQYERREDLIAQEHGNLPEWASDSPKDFWNAADKYERSNAAVYREIVIALPNELSASQNVELVRSYVQEVAGFKTFQYAIHCPIAGIGECPQPHAHIMISDRLPDGIPRVPGQHFRRYNPAFPERGGCKKDSGGKSRSELGAEVTARRARWAELQNEFLAKNGHDSRVDHRSCAARGLPAATESHLGAARTRALNAEGKAVLIARREGRATD